VHVDLGAAVGRAQQGDGEAFRLLYRDIQPRLLRYLHAIAGQDAEDIASETWLQVTRDLPGFAGHLRRVPRLGRHHRPPPRPGPPPQEHPPPRPARPRRRPRRLARHRRRRRHRQTALDTVATQNAVALIATLPPDQAEAVLLRAVLGLDAATAAHILGKRPGAIRTAAHRGLKTLHKKLENGEGERLESGRGC